MRLDHYIFLLLLALIVALGFLFPDYIRKNRELKETLATIDSLEAVLELTPELDTIYRDTVIYALIPRPFPVLRIDTIYDTITRENVVKRSYGDSIPTDDLTLFYQAQTYGELVGLDIWYDLKAPTQIIRTIKLPPDPVKPEVFRAYATMGVSIDENIGIAPGLNVALKKWSVGYGYDIIDDEHNITVGRRLY